MFKYCKKTQIQEKNNMIMVFFEFQTISYKMVCLDTCLYMPIYA